MAYPAAHAITERFWLDLRPDDLHWNAADTGWAGGLVLALRPLGRAPPSSSTSPRARPFDAAEMLGLLARYPITTLCAAPTRSIA